MLNGSGTTETKRDWLLISLLLVIMLLKGIMWSLSLPLWQGPDEEDHYNVIQFIAELGRLPDADDTYLIDEVALSRELADVGRLPYAPEQRQAFSTSDTGPGEAELTQLPASLRSSFELQYVGKLNKATPLYYILAALPYHLFYSADFLTRVHVQRLFALLMSSGLVLVAYLMTRSLLPTNYAMRWTIPTLVAFHPMITQMSAVVSVDGFYIVCYSLLIFLSVIVFRNGLDWRYGLIIGASFSVAFLTKPTINGFAPLIGLLVLYDFWRGKGRRKEVVWGAVVMGIVILVMTTWWMARSLRINNDLFYFNPVLEGHRLIQNPFFDYEPLRHMLDYYQSVWGGIFVTWWAHFGWIDTALPPWVYTLLRVLTFAAILGLFIFLVRNRGKLPSMESWRLGRRSAPLVVWLFLLLTIVIPILLLQGYDLLFWWQYGNGRGLQGRYWLGTIIPMLIFFTIGLLVWVPRQWQAFAHNTLRVGMVLLDFVALLGYVLPRYYL